MPKHPGKRPKPPEKLIIVGGDKTKVRRHIRRLPGKHPRYQPPVVPSENTFGTDPAMGQGR